jgi:tripeptide aminopeptidase
MSTLVEHWRQCRSLGPRPSNFAIPQFRSSAIRFLGLAVVISAVMALPAAAEIIDRPQQQVQTTALLDLPRLAAQPKVQQAFSWFAFREKEIAERQIEVVRIPAPPFGEAPRAQWLAARFRELGLQDVHTDAVGNVIGILPGVDPNAKLVALTAHMDTVFPANTPVEVRRDGERLLGPGISDNAAGLSALLAIAGALQATGLRTQSPLLFVANVGEEGEGDLRGMRHLFQESKWKDLIAATIVIDGAGTDTIIAEALGSKRFEVTVRGPGGHSWSDFGTPNPIVVLARAIQKFTSIPLPASPKTTINVGVISGGTSVNSIPQSATMRVDVRSASMAEIDRLEQALRDSVNEAVAASSNGPKSNGAPPLSSEIRSIGQRPAAELSKDARILRVVRAVDAYLGNQARIQRASTDANIPMSMGNEAVALGAGGIGGAAHTRGEWYDPKGRELGLRRILLTALTLAGIAE